MINTNQQDTTSPSASGYDLLRHDLLPELLGEDEEKILYWAGKALARKKIKENEKIETTHFFHNAYWGSLQPVKEKKNERIYEVVAPHMSNDRPFSLEAGFLAQIVEIEKGVIAESYYEVKKKKPFTVQITVRWDRKDPSPLTENE
ncbi:DUF2507 domain-containing protein [Salipaludibacillus sp. CF4.18]|uniref:DUF2507 domain-containing protein n=1 Tax=Salipaludibacillus sp. CF4.18 TaxID=3373081 RepID=UPI003EE64A01